MKKVSVYLITYNHEPYIAQTIESIVSQHTDFDFELVIGEDCSKDGTRAICEQYAAKYPGIIRLLPSDKNHGAMGNTIRTLHACKGSYIAMCEGDDYWIDSNKLQQQADFLDANPDYALCFSGIILKDEMGWDIPSAGHWPQLTKDIFTIDDIILSEMNIAPTPTMMFRNLLPDPFPDFFVKALSGDWGIQLFITDKGKAKLLPGKMAVYRNHAGGITKTPGFIANYLKARTILFQEFNKYTDYKYDSVFRKRFLNDAKVQLSYGAKDKKGIGKLRHYLDCMPKYLKYSDKINFKELVYYHLLLFFPFSLKTFKKNQS